MSILTSLLAAAAAAPPFDADTATRAYLDTLSGAARARSDAYFEGGYWLPLWGALVSILAYWLMLRLGWSASWSGWAIEADKRKWLQPAIYSVPFAVAGTILTLPWTDLHGLLSRASIRPVEPGSRRVGGRAGLYARP